MGGSRGKQALLPHRADSGESGAKAQTPASRRGEVDQPPRPSFPHGAKPAPFPHTQTRPSARRPRQTTSAAAGSYALTPPSPRCPFPARWWHRLVAAALVAEEERLPFAARPSSSRRRQTRGRTRTSRQRLPAAGEVAPPTLHAQDGAASPRPVPPRGAPRGAEPCPPRRALCPAGGPGGGRWDLSWCPCLGGWLRPVTGRLPWVPFCSLSRTMNWVPVRIVPSVKAAQVS